MLTALVADDEPLARRALRRLGDRHPDLRWTDEACDGDEALDLARRLRPDLVFLDVAMPGRDGLEVARALDPRPLPCIVLVTAYDEHALEAYATGVFDYLVKPVEEARFDRVMERARAVVGGLSGSRVVAGVNRGDGRVVPARRITWIAARDYYAEVHVDEGSFLLRESLESLARRLAHAGLIRVHRKAVVNVARVAEVARRGRRCSVVLDDGTEVPVSRRRRPGLISALRQGGAPSALVRSL